MSITKKNLSIAAVCLGVAFVGCKKDEPPPPPKVVEVAKPPPPPPPPKPPEPVAVASVTLGSAVGTDNAVTTATEKFKPKDTVFASVSTTGQGKAVRLKAAFFFLGKKEIAVGEAIEELKDFDGPANTQFKVAKPSGFPKGKYRVDIDMNGARVSSKDYSVE